MLNADDLRIIVKGLFHDGLDTERLTETGRKELRAALEKVVELYDDAVLAPDRPSAQIR